MSEMGIALNKPEGAKYSATRAARRYVPLEMVNALILSGDVVVAQGVVSNISECGACVIANTVIEPGQSLQIRFSTFDKTELFQSRVKVVWSREGMDSNLEIVGGMVGVAFVEVSWSLQNTITDLLEKGRFLEVGAPDVHEKAAIAIPNS